MFCSFHPKQINGVYAYVDFLTFTTDQSLEEQAQRVMSVGDCFNFEGMSFAKHEPLHVENNIFIPNPLALIYLKMRSYYHNPDRRIKDFADVVEVILRLSTESNIFSELRQIEITNPDREISNQIKKLCLDIEQDHGGIWDLEDIKQELLSRGLLDEFEWDEIPTTVEFFRTKIFKEK